jgi:hypothetical protein
MQGKQTRWKTINIGTGVLGPWDLDNLVFGLLTKAGQGKTNSTRRSSLRFQGEWGLGIIITLINMPSGSLK